MGKLKPDPITAEDLAEFVSKDSDFGFEMRVLAQLRADGFNCSHSGTYRDPVTDKIRQFDIRATMDRDDSTIALAVECKNLNPNNPLLLSSVPRTVQEAFHDLIVYRPGVMHSMHQVQPVGGDLSAYPTGEIVGKKTDQVGRDGSSLVSNDEATFEKLNQAVHSCHDLVHTFANKPSPPSRRAIVPVLVVPVGLLWQVEYDTDGVVQVNPHQVKRATLFRNHAWSVPANYGVTISYRLSHLEIVAFDGLHGLAERFLGPGGLFPP